MIPPTRPAGRWNKIRKHGNIDDKRRASVQMENAHRRRMSVDVGLLVAKRNKMITQGSMLQHSLNYKEHTGDHYSYVPQMRPLLQKGPLLWKTSPERTGSDDKQKGHDLCPFSQHGTTPSSRWASKRRAWSLINKKPTEQKKKGCTDQYHTITSHLFPFMMITLQHGSNHSNSNITKQYTGENSSCNSDC